MRHIWTHPATISTAIIFGLVAVLMFAYVVIKLLGFFLFFALGGNPHTIATYTDNAGVAYYVQREQSFKTEYCIYTFRRNVRFTPFTRVVTREFYSCDQEEKNQFVSGRPNSDGTRAPFLFEYNHITHESKVTPITK